MSCTLHGSAGAMILLTGIRDLDHLVDAAVVLTVKSSHLSEEKLVIISYVKNAQWLIMCAKAFKKDGG